MAAAGASDAPRTKHAATVRNEPVPATTTFTWTLEGLSLATFTDAAPGDYWCSPEFNACGVRWALHDEPEGAGAAEARRALHVATDREVK